MDDSLYDEFGNYIGPELSGSEEVRTIHTSKRSRPYRDIVVFSVKLEFLVG